MALFAIELEPTEESTRFFEQTKKRFSKENLIKNPFKAEIAHNGNMYIIQMEPLYPNITFMFLISALGCLIFVGFRWWEILIASLSSLGFFWSEHFYLLMLKAGLKKVGYKGTIKKINKVEIIRRLASWEKTNS